MSVILAIDTATDVAGIAIHDGQSVRCEHEWTSRRRHTQQLAPLVARSLADLSLGVADLAAVTVAIGPGSYTGLRIGLALAKGIALPTGLPIVPVPTLDSLAASLSEPYVSRGGNLWAVLRAGRGRLIAACYPAEPDRWPDPHGLVVQSVEEVAAAVKPGDWLAGEIDESARSVLAQTGCRLLGPAAGLRRAGWLAELGWRRLAEGRSADAEALVPIYPGPAPEPIR